MFRFLQLLTFAAAAILLAGCTKSTEQDNAAQVTLGGDDAELIVVIALDLSGSFADLMTRDGKAYEFTMRVVDNYFRNAIGTQNRIIIAQLSAHDRQALLWDGTPIQLRQDFPSAAEFRTFLLSRSNPAGSRIHDGVADALDYPFPSGVGIPTGQLHRGNVPPSKLAILIDDRGGDVNPILAPGRLEIACGAGMPQTPAAKVDADPHKPVFIAQ